MATSCPTFLAFALAPVDQHSAVRRLSPGQRPGSDQLARCGGRHRRSRGQPARSRCPRAVGAERRHLLQHVGGGRAPDGRGADGAADAARDGADVASTRWSAARGRRACRPAADGGRPAPDGGGALPGRRGRKWAATMPAMRGAADRRRAGSAPGGEGARQSEACAVRVASAFSASAAGHGGVDLGDGEGARQRRAARDQVVHGRGSGLVAGTGVIGRTVRRGKRIVNAP